MMNTWFNLSKEEFEERYVEEKDGVLVYNKQWEERMEKIHEGFRQDFIKNYDEDGWVDYYNELKKRDPYYKRFDKSLLPLINTYYKIIEKGLDLTYMDTLQLGLMKLKIIQITDMVIDYSDEFSTDEIKEILENSD